MTDTASRSERHAERMKARQAQHRKRMAATSATERGLVLVYTGDGKGKSSSAFGVIVRALGWRQRVGVVQFIKGTWKTGERQFFAQFEEQIDWRTMGEGFTWDTQDLDRDIAAAQAAFGTSREMLESGDYDLVVLDEINVALQLGYLSEDAVIDGLDNRSERTSVILTGRGAKPALCELRGPRERDARGQAPIRLGHQGRTRPRLLSPAALAPEATQCVTPETSDDQEDAVFGRCRPRSPYRHLPASRYRLG